MNTNFSEVGGANQRTGMVGNTEAHGTGLGGGMFPNAALPHPSVVSFSTNLFGGEKACRATLRFESLIFCLDSLSLPADIYI